MVKKKYTLTDAIKQNKKYPKSFWIPSSKDIKELKKNSFAKVIFNNKERMWVKITKINGDNFVGELDNVPVSVPLSYGDVIHFNKKHIINTDKYMEKKK